MDPLTDPPLDTISPLPATLVRPRRGSNPAQQAWLNQGICSLRGPGSEEAGSAPTLVLGSASEQQPRAASSVRPQDASCGSAMATLLYSQTGFGRTRPQPTLQTGACAAFTNDAATAPRTGGS